ncbi:hypothetical protein GLOIN_2v69068 [Rhizophagus irregularis DAOM 181602=DAOM 197198]|uniref:Uncharacterized protein n=1 Tax=Rhizophagus irregularis (strain DAOM 181602 / DAOM 197198 / MUCL 43194) TaxID=747089 RepID=A0A2P4QUU8_RHIID|nr:hypothetical protein GLOIN_2v69068 [Rhizophagus irregularis DAOM 181602=DAOM 197198]POG81433.1 hypothetical protein GLOIN_2v69068 [Rhizophagus irregularis DAOM 181602=DAOM 197198]GET60502.1 hypothetical protein GLOIN_2v69068 [Rhizophagus irregularis DAOM 181602=DAOM 197198]|eukprot:XP_025188299.1 hypothetical protein GLOIN_2v69068 [Rhizophagus irregularis DAOM 181602=DAOM 197198]
MDFPIVKNFTNSENQNFLKNNFSKKEIKNIQSKHYKNEFASNLLCSLDCAYGYYRNSLSFEFRSIN